MTERLYEQDSYRRRFSATVLAVLVGGWLIFAAARMFLPALQQPLYQ